MTGPVKFSAGLVTGFVVGAIVGFAWSTGTKSALSKNTTTSVGGGKVTVSVDYMAAAKQGFLGM